MKLIVYLESLSTGTILPKDDPTGGNGWDYKVVDIKDDQGRWAACVTGINSPNRIQLEEVLDVANKIAKSFNAHDDLTKALSDIAENAVHIGGTDFRIDEKYIRQIEELLKSE